MQNKSFISLFALVFAIVCLYQLSFTWIAQGVEKDAVEYSNGDEFKEKAYLDSISSELRKSLFRFHFIGAYLQYRS